MAPNRSLTFLVLGFRFGSTIAANQFLSIKDMLLRLQIQLLLTLDERMFHELELTVRLPWV